LVGVAPIAVKWSGFEWSSKAVVVALMTFFSTLASTLASTLGGLKAAAMAGCQPFPSPMGAGAIDTMRVYRWS